MEYTQVNMFEAPTPTPAPDTEQVYHADDFACCSLFYQCSDSKRCLASPERSVNCYYRRHLEAGHIFCGKNATGFSRARYDQLLKQVDDLSPDARSALDGILIEFLEYRRGIRQSVVRNRCIEELTSLALFSFRPLAEEFPPADAALSSILSLLPGGQGPKRRTWKSLREWLNGEAVELRDRLASPYCIATLPTNQILYAEEFYRDTLKKSYWTRIYPPTPYAQDGLLSAAKWKEEEQRRIQLSHGYSQEEKDRLMEAALRYDEKEGKVS